MSTPTLDRQQLRTATTRYLRDACDADNAMHTRYSAACTGIVSSHLAGLVSDAEVAHALEWEERRYELDAEPTELDLDLLVALLERILA